MATASTIHHSTTGRASGAAERYGPPVARAGWAAKGVIYALLAFLTLQLALGDPSGSPDQVGAMRSIADESWGTVLLVLLAVGLVAHAVGQWLEATLLADHDAEAVDRLRKIGGGIFYGALAVVAIQLLVGSSGSSGGGGGAREVTAGVLEAPLGRWIVGLVGVGFVVAAGYEAWTGWTKRFMEDLETHEMSTTTRRTTERFGMVGLIARGIVWALIGWFLVQAALQYDPKEAKGLDQALRAVADEAWGTALLLVVAVGFLAYAAYCAVHARYRDVG